LPLLPPNPTGLPSGTHGTYTYLTYRDVVEVRYRCAIFVENNPEALAMYQIMNEFVHEQLKTANDQAKAMGACC
jgi:hypothetical protein